MKYFFIIISLVILSLIPETFNKHMDHHHMNHSNMRGHKMAHRKAHNSSKNTNQGNHIYEPSYNPLPSHWETEGKSTCTHNAPNKYGAYNANHLNTKHSYRQLFKK